MYEAFYGFAEKPFNITPDPKYLFLSSQHQEAISHLLYGVQERGGFIVITGEVGTGKTILCRYLLKQLDDRTEGAVILNPSLSELELLQAINEDFGIRSTGTTKKALLDELNAFLLERRRRGYNMVLVIDEAQNLTPAVLEQLRLLSNIETETEKLIQIILLGQPELRDLLARDDLRQLAQRVTARYHLDPLNAGETGAYIHHRMAVAGNAHAVHLSRSILRRIYRATGGTPRLINVLCDRLLLAGFATGTRDLTARTVKQAVREVTGNNRTRRMAGGPRPARIRYAAAAFATAAVCLGLGWTAGVWNQAARADVAPVASVEIATPPVVATVIATYQPSAGAPTPPTPVAAALPAAPVQTAEPPVLVAAVAPVERVPEAPPAPTLELALAAAPMAPAHNPLPMATIAPALEADSDATEAPLVRTSARVPAPPPPVALKPVTPMGTVNRYTPLQAVRPAEPEPAATQRLISSLFEPRENRVRNRTPAVIERALPPAHTAIDPAPALAPEAVAPGLPVTELRLETPEAVAQLVEGLRPFDSRLSAAQALFGLWGRDFRPPKEANDPDIMDFYKLARNQRMRCSELWTNFDTLRQINLPGILEVFSPGAPSSRYVVLAAVHGDGTGTIVWGPTGTARVDLAALDQCWRRRAFLFWQDPEPVGEIIRDGDQGEDVQWVRASLRELGYLDGTPSDVYDPATRQAVLQFQEAFHLLPDGVVGPRTRMVLYSCLPQYPTPNLTAAGDRRQREHHSRRLRASTS